MWRAFRYSLYRIFNQLDFWDIILLAIVILVVLILIFLRDPLEKILSKFELKSGDNNRINDTSILILDTMDVVYFDLVKAMLRSQNIPFYEKNNASSMMSGLGNCEIYVLEQYKNQALNLINDLS